MDYQTISEKESNFGSITQVSRSLVVAENIKGAKIYELVQVGWKKQFGEIVKLDGDKAYIQCLENTVGLTIGDPIMRTMKPLTIELGPGLLGNIFDGIQRPLDAVNRNDNFVPQDRTVFGLDRNRTWRFEPRQGIKLGMLIAGGEIVGTVSENNIMTEHHIILPPDAKGKITFIAPGGDYDVTEEIVELEYSDKKSHYSMSHFWPIRKERPSVEKTWKDDLPYVSGFRFIDTLYPTTRGGVCGLAGPFNSDRTLAAEAICKCSNSDVVVHVSCGERSRDVYTMMNNLAEITMRVRGREEHVIQKTCLIANTPDMSLPSREASIYTGLTIAEYFRDTGCNTTLMVDSMSRWAEAVRETSNNLKELPVGDGYPAYLSSRMSKFFGRAGVVKCLGSPEREGSITIIGTVSPPGGDLSDPVSKAILENVQAFWDINPELEKRMMFPGFTWRTSFAKTERAIKTYAEYFDMPDAAQNRKIFFEILQRIEEVREIILLNGRTNLTEHQKLICAISEITYDSFLNQDVFSSYDYYCPAYKGLGMAKCTAVFYEEAKKAIDNGFPLKKIATQEEIRKLYWLKFTSSGVTKQEMKEIVDSYCKDITKKFEMLVEEAIEVDDYWQNDLSAKDKI